MTNVLSASDAAREISRRVGEEVRPRDITLLFYDRALPDNAAPVISGRRVIPESLLSDIVAALRARGRLPQSQVI